MANIKITDLTAYTDPVSTDVLPIVDVASDVTKKVSIANVMKNASLGSAAACGIAFDGDPNSGLYSPGADQVAISTNGTGRLFVDASGNVGLGTSTPSNVLEVSSASNSYIRSTTTTNSVSGIFGAYTNSVDIGSTSSHALNFYTAGVNRATLDTSGRLGVGTTSPQVNLHLKDATNPRLRFEQNNSSSQQQIESSAGNFVFTSDVINAIGGAAFVFNTATTERFRCDSSGRLLVGTSSAVAPDGTNYPAFQVSRPQSSGLNASALIREVEASTSWPILYINKNRSNNPMTADNKLGSIDYYGDTGSSDKLGARIDAAAEGTWTTSSHPTRLVFSVCADGASSPTEAMRIKNSRILNFANTPVYADNAAAKTGGLVDGDVYRKSDGTLMIVYT